MKLYIIASEVEFGVELNEKEVNDFALGMGALVESGELFDLITKIKDAFDPVVTDEDEESEEEETQEESKDDMSLDEEGLIDFKVVKSRYSSDRYTLTTAWLKDHGIDYEVDYNTFGDERATAKINILNFCALQKYLKSHGVDATAMI